MSKIVAIYPIGNNRSRYLALLKDGPGIRVYEFVDELGRHETRDYLESLYKSSPRACVAFHRIIEEIANGGMQGVTEQKLRRCRDGLLEIKTTEGGGQRLFAFQYRGMGMGMSMVLVLTHGMKKPGRKRQGLAIKAAKKKVAKCIELLNREGEKDDTHMVR